MNARTVVVVATAAVAFGAGGGQSMLWESTLVGLVYTDQYTHAVALVAGTLSPVAAPLVVFLTGYALTRFAGHTRFAAPMATALFLGGVIGSLVSHVVVLGPLWSTLIYYPSPGQALLAHGGSALATGLYVCLAGIGGIGWYALRDGKARTSPAPGSATNTTATTDAPADADARAETDTDAHDETGTDAASAPIDGSEV